MRTHDPEREGGPRIRQPPRGPVRAIAFQWHPVPCSNGVPQPTPPSRRAVPGPAVVQWPRSDLSGQAVPMVASRQRTQPDTDNRTRPQRQASLFQLCLWLVRASVAGPVALKEQAQTGILLYVL